EKLTNKIQNCFTVEQLILKRLGNHPRIVKYHGWQDEPQRLRGLILSWPSHGNLQQYLELNYEAIDMCTKQQWCRQAVEAVAYIHSQGVWHSDLRPDNYLVHATTPTSLDLWLCDFGGSVCKELRLDGKQLPDPGFFDPNAQWVASVATDIFSLGSILYGALVV
ncbi:kinase-like protein, partial [Aaosphaeria arxii CBS 175.79]